MAIIKAKQKEYHARIPNDTARDRNLSLKAKGLLCVLLSMDEDWKIYKSQISEFSTDKRDSTYAAFNELIEKGYVIDKGRARNQNGHLAENLYEVYAEKPCLNEIKPIPDFPTQEKPTQVKQPLSNTIITYSNNSMENPEKENPEEYLNIITETSSVEDNQLSFFEEEAPKPEEPKVMTLRQRVIDYWLKDFHPDWNFSVTDGKKINELIKKLKRSLSSKRTEYTDDDVLNLFMAFCKKLPEFYKSQNLSVLEAKYDTIIEEIKIQKNGQRKQTPTQQTKSRAREYAKQNSHRNHR